MSKRDTSRNKKSLNCECFAHNLFVYSKRIKVGVMVRMGPISGLVTHENLRNKLNTTQRLQFINRNIRFGKFIKSVIRLLIFLSKFATACCKHTYDKH